MMITKDQVNYLDNVAGRTDKEAFMQSETAQMYKDMGADLEAVYELDLPPPEEDGLGEEVMEIDLVNPEHEQGKVFNFASQTLHDHHWGVGQYKQEGDASLERMRSTNPRAYASRMQSRQRAEGRSPQEISEFGVEYGGNLNWNLGSGLINWAKVDDLPPEVAIAQAGLLEMYERLPDWTWSGTGRMLKGFATDPFTYAGGIGGFRVVQQLIRGGGIAAARSRLMQSAAKALGYTIIGSEGAAYGVLDDLMKQRLKHNPEDGEFVPNYQQAMIAGGFGAALTAGGTAAIQAAPGMYRAGRDVFNRMAGDGTTLRSGIGPLDTRPEAQMAAQPDAMGFRSGLINMLDALPESATGEQMLATLSDPQRLGEYGAKAEEISLTGLDKFLREAEGPVTKSDIAAHLEANRVELGEARNTGSSNYLAGEYDTYTPEAYDFDDLISSLDADEYEFSRGYISGYNEGDDEDIVDVMIIKRFDIFDPERNRDVLDEIELTMNNNSSYFDDEEGEAAREAATEIIQRIRNEIQGGVGDLPSSIKNRISELYEDLNQNLYHGEVFDAMESRASYDVFDPNDYYNVGKFDSEDEAVHRAKEYIESLGVDEDAGPGGRFSSITFPTNDGSKPENYKEVRLLMPEDDERFPRTDVSQHFEQNTFAHYRSTDREVVFDQPDQPDMFGGADPKDVMFVEEIQSDLMQAGGRRGYQTEEVMDTWKAEGTEIHERMKDKLRAFGYGDEVTKEADTAIMTNLSGLYEGFSRMMKGKDRVEAMQKFIDSKYINEMEGMKINFETGVREYDPDIHKPYDAAESIIMEAIKSLPNKKMKDEQLYDAFNQFVAALQSLRFGGNEVSGAVRDLSPKRYGSKMVDSDGYDRGLEFLEKLTSKDLRDFYKARDKAIIAKSGVPDIPLKKDWVELTMKRAIYDAIEEGKTMIAFPNHAETVGAIEYGGRPATGAIARLYEKEVPKILQKLVKQTGGEVRTGALANSPKATRGTNNEYPDQGSVIILDLSKNPQKVKREGFAIPAIAGGATALTAAQQMQQQDQQPTQ